MRGVSISQLRIVAAIARTGRVSAAADAMGVTPPAATLQLKALEERLGFALFERTREGMKLTQAGQVVLEAATGVEDRLTEAVETLDSLRGLRRGHVTVGVVSTAKYFVPGALGGFHRLHPEIDISLVVGNRADVIAALASRDCDVAVMGLPPGDLATESVVIGDHPHVIVADPKHPLVRRTRIPLSSLAGERFIVRELGSGTRMLMERLFAEADLAVHAGMEMTSNETIKQAVIAGLGIAFISGHTIAAEVGDKRLAILDVEGLPARREWRIVRLSGRPAMPAANAMWSFLEGEGGLYLPPILKHIRSAARRRTTDEEQR